MKQYTGTKTVMAEPMTMGEAYELNLLKVGVRPSECETDKAGYLVEYEGGYKSWSPAEPFERVYKLSETFVDRLKNEYEELTEKCEKLGKFLADKDECIKKVGITKYDMLVRQRQHMNDYRSVVGCRLYELGIQSMKQSAK